MIQAVSWFCAEHCGLYLPGGKSWEKRSPVISGSAEIPEVIGRAVKYYARMTTETRYCLCAASVAMKEMGWDGGEREIGLLSAGSDGCAKANEEYFRDYVANGRTLGRGNLFIYTLPTSALGEVAIALGVTGPCMFVHEGGDIVAGLAKSGEELIADGESMGVLGIWSDGNSAVCLVIDGRPSPVPSLGVPVDIAHGRPGEGERGWLVGGLETSPLQLCGKLRGMVQGA